MIPNSEPMIVGVILAAGAGRRLGLGPKAHVVLEGETLLSRAVRCCRKAGLTQVQVVGRIDDPELRAAAEALDAAVVLNPNPEAGMFSSVRLAIAAALASSAGARGLLAVPVDYPRVRPETVRLLDGALESAGPSGWVRPVFEGRHGHPILLGSALLPLLLDCADTLPLRDALVAVKAIPLDVPCDDPGVLANLNVPGDLPSPQR